MFFFIKRFYTVLIVESMVLLSLSTCALPQDDEADKAQEIEIATSILDSTKVAIEESLEQKKAIIEEKAKEYAEEQAREEEQAEENSEEDSSEEEAEEFSWNGEVITPSSGVANGPSGYETYYNLPMGGVVSIMRGLGYDEESYPYWVRDDGCKMLGSYIMVAANLDLRPYGTILPCSRGMAMVCDTGDFAYSNPYQLDIAVSW